MKPGPETHPLDDVSHSRQEKREKFKVAKQLQEAAIAAGMVLPEVNRVVAIKEAVESDPLPIASDQAVEGYWKR